MSLYDRMSREDLLRALEMSAKNWLAHDGCWFLAAEERFGLEAAIELDSRSWERYAAAEARRIIATFAIPPSGGLPALEQALGLRMYSLVSAQHTELSSNTSSIGTLQRGVCSMQVRVAREPLERRLVDALLTRLSEPAVLARIERRVRVAARERVGKGHVDERAALLQRIERLADLIAAGDHSPALLRKLREMEQTAASMRPAAARVPSGAAVEIGALRQALATKGDALKRVLARMARVTIGGEESGRTASCAVYVGAGGES